MTETFEEFCETAVEVVKEPFKSMGELPPTWFLQRSDGKVGMFVTPWVDFKEKEEANQRMRLLMEKYEIMRYALITEAWMVKRKNPEGTKLAKDWKGPLPSQSPDREEIVMIVGGDLEGNCVEGMADITRDEKGKPTLGKFELKYNEYTMEGRFVNLLRKIH
jgi:hypothetical protein